MPNRLQYSGEDGLYHLVDENGQRVYPCNHTRFDEKIVFCDTPPKLAEFAPKERCFIPDYIPPLPGTGPGIPVPTTVPDPDTTIPDPDPETSSEIPDPETSSEIPDPETSSEIPDPETSSEIPDPETSSEIPDPETSSEIPDPDVQYNVSIVRVKVNPVAICPATDSYSYPAVITAPPQTPQEIVDMVLGEIVGNVSFGSPCNTTFDVSGLSATATQQANGEITATVSIEDGGGSPVDHELRITITT